MTQGLCQCGCGKPTNIIQRTDRNRGLVKGQPRCYLNGHASRPHVADRFWANVRKTDGCWIWLGSLRSKRKGEYGALNVYGQRTTTHRFSWQLHYGPIPDGQCVLHRCDNPKCVRPDHLFLGTNPENTQDKTNKGRQAKGSGHGMSKLTEVQVAEIRRLRTQGLGTQRGVARLFGVDHGTIRFIERGLTWKHVMS